MNIFEPYTFSDRLGLREFSGADILSVHEYASDQAVTQWCTWGPNSKAQTAAFVQEAAKQQLSDVRTSYSLAATFDGRVIGSVAVWVTDPEARNGELGYTFHRAYWGKGYATQYVAQLLAVGVTSLNLERITATCHPENVGSRRALEKNGFSYEGRLRSHRLVNGYRRDSMLFSILRHEISGF